jgi:hypothetical protein
LCTCGIVRRTDVNLLESRYAKSRICESAGSLFGKRLTACQNHTLQLCIESPVVGQRLRRHDPRIVDGSHSIGVHLTAETTIHDRLHMHSTDALLLRDRTIFMRKKQGL